MQLKTIEDYGEIGTCVNDILYHAIGDKADDMYGLVIDDVICELHDQLDNGKDELDEDDVKLAIGKVLLASLSKLCEIKKTEVNGETCNHCGGDIECDDNVVALVCPHCGNITGVCANCEWHTDGDRDRCEHCPFNIKINDKED